MSAVKFDDVTGRVVPLAKVANADSACPCGKLIRAGSRAYYNGYDAELFCSAAHAAAAGPTRSDVKDADAWAQDLLEKMAKVTRVVEALRGEPGFDGAPPRDLVDEVRDLLAKANKLKRSLEDYQKRQWEVEALPDADPS